MNTLDICNSIRMEVEHASDSGIPSMYSLQPSRKSFLMRCIMTVSTLSLSLWPCFLL